MYDKPRLVVGGTDTHNVKMYDKAALVDTEVLGTHLTDKKPTHHLEKVNIEVMDHGPIERKVI